MEQKAEIIKSSIDKMLNKEFNVYFFVPSVGDVYAQNIVEIYQHALVLKESEYSVYIMGDKPEYPIPSYLSDELKSLPHKNLQKRKGENGQEELFLDENITLSDTIVIPEYFVNICESTKSLPCNRVLLVSSYEYFINSLVPGVNYSNFGIKNIITTSQTMEDFIKNYDGEKTYDIKQYTIGIPEYFKNNDFKKPIVTFLSRNASDIMKIVKLFYKKYPQLQWISFEDLRGKNRKEFANKMSESIATIWLDRIAGHGTTAIEAMKCNTITIGLIPDIMPEYVVSNSGIWAENIYQIPEALEKVLITWIEDKINKEVYDKMKEVSSKYNMEDSNKSINDCYSYFFEKRKVELEQILEAETKVVE